MFFTALEENTVRTLSSQKNDLKRQNVSTVGSSSVNCEDGISFDVSSKQHNRKVGGTNLSNNNMFQQNIASKLIHENLITVL